MIGPFLLLLFIVAIICATGIIALKETHRHEASMKHMANLDRYSEDMDLLSVDFSEHKKQLDDLKKRVDTLSIKAGFKL